MEKNNIETKLCAEDLTKLKLKNGQFYDSNIQTSFFMAKCHETTESTKECNNKEEIEKFLHTFYMEFSIVGYSLDGSSSQSDRIFVAPINLTKSIIS